MTTSSASSPSSRTTTARSRRSRTSRSTSPTSRRAPTSRATTRPSPIAAQTLAICALAALALPLGQALIAPAAAPARGEIENPCEDRDLPGTGGIGGFLQDAGLIALDRAACKFGSSREELALAIADPEEAQAYEREYGVDPRSATDLLRGVLP